MFGHRGSREDVFPGRSSEHGELPSIADSSFVALESDSLVQEELPHPIPFCDVLLLFPIQTILH